jgi:ribosomal protein L2
MIADWIEIFIQYGTYFLWGSLLLVLLLIANNKYKARQAAKHAKRNPEIRLYSYEFPKASGEINFFFEADEKMECTFFLMPLDKGEKIILTKAAARKGGNKLKIDSTNIPNGIYYYGIETASQLVEKKIAIEN